MITQPGGVQIFFEFGVPNWSSARCAALRLEINLSHRFLCQLLHQQPTARSFSASFCLTLLHTCQNLRISINQLCACSLVRFSSRATGSKSFSARCPAPRLQQPETRTSPAHHRVLLFLIRLVGWLVTFSARLGLSPSCCDGSPTGAGLSPAGLTVLTQPELLHHRLVAHCKAAIQQTLK